jgi:regulator of protease activity HflC (stomatin/prohibitin superfamily)
MVKVSLRTVAMDVPSQDTITRDNVSLKVNAVIYFRVMDPERAVVAVEDYLFATSQIAQTTLRSVLGQSELDELLSERDRINQKLQRIIDEHTEALGDQGERGGGEVYRPSPGDAACHGPAGRGRTGEARQDHPRGWRVAGFREAGAGGAGRGPEGRTGEDRSLGVLVKRQDANIRRWSTEIWTSFVD